MPEQELDLLKLSACLMTQTGTGAPQIVRGNAIHTAFRGPGFYDAPDDFRTEAARSNAAGLVNRPRDWAGRDTRGCQPVVHGKLDPCRDRHCSNVTTLAGEVCDYPMLFPLLEVLDGEPSYLCPPEAATQENRDHGIVAFRTQIVTTESCKQSLPLVSRQPIPNTHAMLLDALDPTDSGRKVGA